MDTGEHGAAKPRVFGDSGAPTFVDDPRETRAARRLVAVVSDGGIDCADKDARVRVDTAGVQEWIARVIREELGDRSSAQEPLPVIDMHLHASAADDNGPPPLALCVPPVDTRSAIPKAVGRDLYGVAEEAPVFQPRLVTPDRRGARDGRPSPCSSAGNVIGVLSGPPERVQQWRKAAPDRFIPGLQFRFGREELTPDSLRRLYAEGRFAVFAEVGQRKHRRDHGQRPALRTLLASRRSRRPRRHPRWHGTTGRSLSRIRAVSSGPAQPAHAGGRAHSAPETARLHHACRVADAR